MIRGTTPTITMKLPSKVSVINVTKARISIEQSGKKIISKDYIKDLPTSVTKDEAGNSLAVKLTQEESLLLSANNKAYVQLKVKIDEDTVLASLPLPMVVTDIIDEEKL